MRSVALLELNLWLFKEHHTTAATVTARYPKANKTTLVKKLNTEGTVGWVLQMLYRRTISYVQTVTNAGTRNINNIATWHVFGTSGFAVNVQLQHADKDAISSPDISQPANAKNVTVPMSKILYIRSRNHSVSTSECLIRSFVINPLQIKF